MPGNNTICSFYKNKYTLLLSDVAAKKTFGMYDSHLTPVAFGAAAI
jgi:hypothetical protein